MSRRRRIVRVEELLGRKVTADNGSAVGRIEEIRVDRRSDAYEVVEYRLGPGALAERFALLHRWLGREVQTLIVRWDQIDVSRPETPRLLCGVEELRRE